MRLTNWILLLSLAYGSTVLASERIDELEGRIEKLEQQISQLAATLEQSPHQDDSSGRSLSDTSKFSPGLWMEFYRLNLKGSRELPLQPEGTPLGALLDTDSPKFEFSFFMKDSNLKKYHNEPYGLSWTGYLNILEGGPQIFTLDVAYKSDQLAEKSYCSASLSLDSKSLIELKPKFGSHDRDKTKTEIAQINLEKGIYPVQVWLTCGTRLLGRVPILQGLSAQLNYRAPSDRTLTPVPKDQLLHKI
ncbi:hypothetical protein NF212_21830 [Parasalinivibrio latis]|uniref:hypothetical protein n=1 Tax=Parasalinivibrio latis TaxID=2952610 RepID=UPI0030E57E16